MADGTTGPVDPDYFATDITVPEQVPARVRDGRRGDVVLRHARLTGRGRPTFCSPSRAEQTGVVHLRSGSGTDGKVIYPTREAAEAAARELESLGSRRLRPYLCARSRHGHYHLTTDRAAVQRRIPRQAQPADVAAAPRTDPVARVADAAALHRRIPRQNRSGPAVTPLDIPQQRRPA